MDEEDAGGGVLKSPIRRLGSTRKLLVFNSKRRELINELQPPYTLFTFSVVLINSRGINLFCEVD